MADCNEQVIEEMQRDFLKYDLQYCIVELYTAEDLPPLYTYISQGVPEFWRTTSPSGSTAYHMRVYDINQDHSTQLGWWDGVLKWDLSRVRLTRHDPKEMMAGVAQ